MTSNKMLLIKKLSIAELNNLDDSFMESVLENYINRGDM